jgi:sugar phosphate isomerase/epimerase
VTDLPAPASELDLYAGCLPATPFRSFVAAAEDAGFDGISVWPLMYRRAQSREGLEPATMRAIVLDAGLHVTELDACFDWIEPEEGTEPGREWARDQFFDAANQLGADTVVAAARMNSTHLDLDTAVEGFADLCDDAARHGLRISLEFVAFSAIPDAATAWRIIDAAGRDNAGLVVDIGHHVRSGGDESVLRRIPPERIYTVQLVDGPADAPTDLFDEAQWHRADPGEGDFDVAGVLQRLAADGVRARIGPEIYRAGWSERDPMVVATDLMASCRRVLGAPPGGGRVASTGGPWTSG